MKKFLHYGKEIMVQWGEESFVYTLKRKGVKYTELPILIPEAFKFVCNQIRI